MTKAQLIDAAVPNWLAAAQLAAAGTRYQEALSHVDSGLGIVAQVTNDSRINLEVSLLVTGTFSFRRCRVRRQAAARMLARVQGVLDHDTDANGLAIALWAIRVHAWVRGDFPKSLTTFERLTALAEETRDFDRLVFAIRY